MNVTRGALRVVLAAADAVWRPGRALTARLMRSRGGNIGLIAAIVLPVVGLAAVGGVQFSYVVGTQVKTQDIADTAALMAAQQLGVGAVGIEARAQSWAAAQLTTLPASTTYQVTVTNPSTNKIVVNITTNTPSFFGPALPVGGFNTSVTSTAQSLGENPLCVLITGTAGSGDLQVQGTSQMAANCLVYSDTDVTVASGAALTAPQTEAVTAATGSITPAPLVGAQAVTDPFAGLAITPPGSCSSQLPDVTYSVNTTLSAGTPVCNNVIVAANTVLTLASGVHYFGYGLTLQAGATLKGSNVVLMFGNGSVLSFAPTSSVTLYGRTTGTYAGFVIITSPLQTANFVMPNDPLAKVTGTIYSRTAPLVLTGSGSSTSKADWTVFVAPSMQVQGAAQVAINSNYSGSTVPVPPGVGVATGGAMLLN